MNKFFKLTILLLCVLSFSACKNNPNDSDNDGREEISYPSYAIEEYEKMDKYVQEETIDNIKYKYTYFFKDNLCVNVKEEITFSNENDAKNFYTEIEEMEDYTDLTRKGKTIVYYNNPEYFIYLYYPKDVLINLLNSTDIES